MIRIGAYNNIAERNSVFVTCDRCGDTFEIIGPNAADHIAAHCKKYGWKMTDTKIYCLRCYRKDNQ